MLWLLNAMLPGIGLRVMLATLETNAQINLQLLQLLLLNNTASSRK
jgi:hypothetical protein